MLFATAWLVAPLVLASLALGVGLLVEGVSGAPLPGSLIVPLGLAGVIVVVQALTAVPAMAQLAPPFVVALAVLGIGLFGLPRSRTLDVGAVAAGSVAYLGFAAPTLLSGRATFAGYIKLDDTATFLALTDRVMEHGRGLAGLAPSTYEATLAVNLAHGYPVGSLLPLGVAARLTRTDPAWLFQPVIALFGACLALALYGLLRQSVRSRAFASVAAIVAAQASLLYGYSLWGGVKEVCAAALVALVAALTAAFARGSERARAGLPLAVALAALLAVLSLGGALWFVPELLVVAFAAVRLRRRAIPAGVALAVLGVALALPTFAAAPDFLRTANAESLTSAAELGNLIRPLDPLQVLGIWPVGDFRLAPSDRAPTYVLLVVVVVAAALGLAACIRRKAYDLALYGLATLLACAAIAAAGSPWVAGKAYAIASPCALALAFAGAAAVLATGRRVEALVAAAALVAGVGWSDALAYHDATLAPDNRLRELERIGERFAGQGPALMTEYEPYGVRHFLRRLDAEGASELRRRPVPLRSGRLLGKAEYADVDRIQLAALLVYRSLVLRRSPVASRPPPPFRLVWRGTYYEVWQRPQPAGARFVDLLPLGGPLTAFGLPRCSDVRRLAAEAGRRGVLVAPVPAGATRVVSLAGAARPATWRPAATPGAVAPLANGVASGTFSLPRAGSFRVWVGGSVPGRLDLTVDGQRLGVRDQLNPSGQYVLLGRLVLRRGPHSFALRYGVERWRPGEGGFPSPLGPLVLSDAGSSRPLKLVPARRARSLCGRKLDWVEATTNPSA